MFLIPPDAKIICIALVILSYLVGSFLLVKSANKKIQGAEIVRILDNMRDIIITGGNEVTNANNADLNKFEINGETYTIDDNHLTLAELVVQNDNDSDYDNYLKVVTQLVKERYERFRFLRVSPTFGDFNSGYFLSFTITREQVPVEYEYLFRTAVSKGLTDDKINDLFLEKVKADDVLPLGDVEIVAGTAISSVTQADDLMVNIVFMPRDYYEKHLELKAEQEQKDGEIND